MKKKIFCKFLKKKSEKQKFQIYPGKLGKFIFENISQEAWEIWKEKQTIIINENRLNMTNIQDRKLLEKEMQLFLFGKEFSIK